MNTRSIITYLAAVATLVCLDASRAHAAPPPKLNAHPPLIVEVGKARQLTLNGDALGDVDRVELADPRGVTVELVKADKPNAKRVTVKIAAAKDASLGDRELRLISDTGVSNPVNISIGQFTEVTEAEPNTEPGEAQAVALPALLTGKIGNGGDMDRFTFDARKGQRLVFDLAAERIGSPLDATLAVHDAHGRELAAANDHFGVDPLLVFDVPADGKYTLIVRDLQYRGGGDWYYRIEAGDVPYVEAVFPLGGRRGESLKVHAIGHNLGDAATVDVDLSNTAAARTDVRTKVDGRWSNALPFHVSDHEQFIESEPNDAHDKANKVTLPAAINGRIDRSGDEDVYLFNADQKGKYRFEVLAQRFGSPIDTLLVLHDKNGKVIEQVDDPKGSMSADAVLERDLDPGVYSIAVRDLLYGSGARHVYRLTAERVTAPDHDFAVRFLPDTPRVHRNGRDRLWVEVTRRGGYKGDVTLELTGLPKGVTADPATFGVDTSGVFTIHAAPDAPLGPVRFGVRATGKIGNEDVTRNAAAELDRRAVGAAYLTVLDAAPFVVKPLDLSPQLIARYGEELDALEKTLSTMTPELAKARDEWAAKQSSDTAEWVTITPTDLTSGSGVRFMRDNEGAYRVGGAVNPEKETYTLTLKTNVKGITAFRLDALADDKLPANGPGRAANGNFVLNSFEVTRTGDDGKPVAVELHKAKADFSQNSWDVGGAVDSDGNSGWAVSPQFGKDHWAIFETKQPLGDGDTELTIKLHQNYGSSHTLGRFRISLTTAAEPKAGDVQTIPPDVAAALKVPADQRTDAQRQAVDDHFLSIAPQLAEQRSRAAVLRKIIGPAREIAQLEAQLAAPDKKIDEAQAKWEQEALADNKPTFSNWHYAGLFKGGFDAAFDRAYGPEKEPGKFDPKQKFGKVTWDEKPDWTDGVVHNVFPEDAGANYIHRAITVATARQLDLSLGSDDSITVWINGKKVLANKVGRGAAPDQEKVTIDLTPGENHLLIKVCNGAGPSGFYFKAAEGSAAPQDIIAILKTPNDQRSDEQRAKLRDHYRSIDPSLKQLRDRLAKLQKQTGSEFPPVAKQQKAASMSVMIDRDASFTGEVTVTLEGYASGRDEKTGQPEPITNHIDLKPVKLSPDELFGVLEFTPKDKGQTGTRHAVLRAEAKVGGETVITYSEPFPLTVNK